MTEDQQTSEPDSNQTLTDNSVPVYLDVYYLYVSNRPIVFPTGGGVYHSGVDVYNKEWSYSGTKHDNGLWFQKPVSPNATSPFKCRLLMGRCKLTEEQVNQVIESMRPDYPYYGYNVLHHNCHDFSTEFISRICEPGYEQVPGWLNRLARIGRCLAPCLSCCCDFFKKSSGRPEDAENSESKPLIEGPSSETFGPEAQLPQESVTTEVVPSASSSSSDPAPSEASSSSQPTTTGDVQQAQASDSDASSSTESPSEPIPVVNEVPLNLIRPPSSPSTTQPPDVTSAYATDDSPSSTVSTPTEITQPESSNTPVGT